MKLVQFGKQASQRIDRFESNRASSSPVGHGEGEAHVYCLHIEEGGSIGRHPAGFGQLLLVVQGQGWCEGGDGVRVRLKIGEAAYFEKGEMHSKGSDTGMTAIMVQVEDLTPFE